MTADYKYIACCFRKQDNKTSKHLFNWFAQCKTGSPFIHVELLFINDGITVTVDAESPVTMEQHQMNKYIDTKKWTCLAFKVSAVDYRIALQFCQRQQDKPFDYTGVACFDFKILFAYSNISDEESWICSRLAARTLQICRVLPEGFNVNITTPATLLDSVLDSHVVNWLPEQCFFRRSGEALQAIAPITKKAVEHINMKYYLECEDEEERGLVVSHPKLLSAKTMLDTMIVDV